MLHILMSIVSRPPALCNTTNMVICDNPIGNIANIWTRMVRRYYRKKGRKFFVLEYKVLTKTCPIQSIAKEWSTIVSPKTFSQAEI